MVPTVIENLSGAFQSEESQEAFAEAGKSLGKALINGILYIGEITNLPALLLRKLRGTQNWAAATSTVPDYSGAPIDLGGYDFISAQSTVNIGTMNLTANNGDTAQSVFASIRRAAAQG